MSIRLPKKDDPKIILRTKNTMYAMEILQGKYLVHTYYGKKSSRAELSYNGKPKPKPFSVWPADTGRVFSPDSAMMEYPFFNDGDYRATALRLLDTETGSDATDFVFKKARRFKGRVDIPGVPYGEADENTETLEVLMTDAQTGCELRLYYTLFGDCDVIARTYTLTNKSKTKTVRILKSMSLCLDIPCMDLDMISFWGYHTKEENYQREALGHGIRRITSRRGASSPHYNPFFMLAGKKTTEEKGEAYGFHQVWSGSYLNEIETNFYGHTRVVMGLGDECFSMELKPGQSFTAPECLMTYTEQGIGQVSRNMHRFVRKHILPPEVFANRPVVLNSWEAFEFNIDATLMEDFAKCAAEIGMDMVVMDDGWFGKRTSSMAGLGDWFENPERFPDGLGAFVTRVKNQGVKFGIWIEPEMVNPDSDLFRAHPEWCLRAPGRDLLYWRNQAVLDMANPEVVDYLKQSFAKTFAGVAIDYFKWDMNSHMSRVYSQAYPPERQGEVAYRYMLGVYELFRWLRETYPNAMIENCSSGGGRYDLGMMKYSTQIWASDNTIPEDRVFIQCGSTFGYPPSVMSCHVSNRQNYVEDPRRLDYGFRVAMNGPLGYELNALTISDKAKQTMKEQIAEYRRYEHLILNGEFYRLLNPFECGKYAYYFASEDASELLLTYLQNEGDMQPKRYKLKLLAADRTKTYRDSISGKRYSGEDLRRGIEITSQPRVFSYRMFHFVAE